MANVIGNTFFIFYYIIHPDFFYLFSIDKEAEIKKLYDIKILSYNDLEWRPESWLTFLLTGPPAGNKALVTIVPRLDPNSLVLTQSKEVRKHARQASRLAQGQTHKTRGNGSIIDLTDEKVKSVKHYHYIKPEASMDAITILKRKAETMATIISSLDELGDVETSLIYKRQHLQVNILILKELNEQEAKVVQSLHNDLLLIHQY